MALTIAGSTISREAVGNLWWLSQNPAVYDTVAYQLLSAGVFVVAFPANVLIRSIQSIYFFLICDSDTKHVERNDGTEGTMVKDRMKECIRGLSIRWPQVAQLCTSVLLVELFVSVAVIPLQFASLLVFTLPITLPLIVRLQAAVPISIKESVTGLNAIKRSMQLVKPIRWSVAMPFLAIIVFQRIVESGKERLIAVLPIRYYSELIEIPLGILLLGSALSLFLALARQVLPFTVYTVAQRGSTNDA